MTPFREGGTVVASPTRPLAPKGGTRAPKL